MTATPPTSSSPLRAMLLAAGRGSRMRPFTDHTPKPLIEVGGKSLISWHLERLHKAGIQQVVINHAWLGEQIVTAIGDGSQYGLKVHYSAENPALETAAGIKNALALLKEKQGKQPFLVISTDIWTDWNAALANYMAQRLVNEHALAHLLLVPNPAHNPDGDFTFDSAHSRVKNKHNTNTKNTYTYSGIGVYMPEFFAAVSASTPTPLREPLQQALAHNQVLGTVYQGTWADIGTPERLQQIEQSLA